MCNLEFTELLSDRYVLVVGRDHPLAAGSGSANLETVGQIDLVGYRVCRAHAAVERFIRSRGIEPRFVFRAEDNHLLQGLAATGVGAAIMPALAIDRSRNDIVLLDLDDIPRRRIGLVRHRDRYQTPAAAAFVRLARETAADLAERIPGLVGPRLLGIGSRTKRSLRLRFGLQEHEVLVSRLAGAEQLPRALARSWGASERQTRAGARGRMDRRRRST